MNEKVVYEMTQNKVTPAFVFDTDVLREHVLEVTKTFEKTAKLCYAMKANPFIIKEIEDIVPYFEVCSPGEHKICTRAGIDVSKIVISGVNKEYSDIEEAMLEGITIFTIESIAQFELLRKLTRKHNKIIKVLVRITSGNQFGVDEDTLYNFADRLKNDSHMIFLGIQLYSGTQKKKPSDVEDEIAYLDSIYKTLRDEYGVNIAKIEYGPGLFVPYFTNDKDIATDMIATIKGSVADMEFRGELVFEMGRYIAAECGSYVTSIADVKKNKQNNYCIIDGGINHLNYYGQTMAMKPMHYNQYKNGNKVELTEDVDRYTVCGSLCTVADVILKNMSLLDATIGDVIVFEKVGAYSVTEGIYMFLSRDMPAIYFYSKDKGLKLVRDTFETNRLNYILEKEK